MTEPLGMNWCVIDNVLSDEDFWDYKNRIQFARFDDVVSQGQKYSDISQDVTHEKIFKAMAEALGFTPINVLSFLRAYRDLPEYRHPMWIHTDTLFADYIGIFFVQPSEFPQDDGFALWKNLQLDAIELRTKDHTGEANKVVDSQSKDPEMWEMWKRFEFKENRLVICPASYFHSTANYGHHGKTLDTCRIVHVLFFNEGPENE